MKILKQVLVFSLFCAGASSWASDKGEELSDEVERVLSHYGLSYPQTLVQVTRDHCLTEEDEKINAPRYQEGFQAAQNIIAQTNAHFRELYERHRDSNQNIFLESSIVLLSSSARISFPQEPVREEENEKNETPTSVEKGGKFFQQKEELEIIERYANYVLAEYKNVKSLEVTGATEVDPRIINLKRNIKDETYVWVMTLSCIQSTLKTLQKLYENALENAYAYNHLSKSKAQMDSKGAQLMSEKLRVKEQAMKENLDIIDGLVALFPEIFKEPMGVHKGWYDSLWRGIAAYTKTDRSEQLKEKFYPLLDSDSIISATEKCIKGIWTRTRLIEKKVPASQYWKYFKPITTIAFSKTQKFEPLIPPLEDYQKEQLPLTFNIKSDPHNKKDEKKVN